MPGGCADGAPAQPAAQPEPFTGTPTDADIEARNQGIAARENLLNTYRCLFNVDTELVPDGCPEPEPTEPEPEPTEPEPTEPEPTEPEPTEPEPTEPEPTEPEPTEPEPTEPEPTEPEPTEPEPTEPEPTEPVGDSEIAALDQTIALQEALLNAYRCAFGVDTGVVPGGCADGAPAQPAAQPEPFTGTPTDADIEARNQGITARENLLNTYRCLFNVDTELVPDGCPEPEPTEPEPEPTEPDPPSPSPPSPSPPSPSPPSPSPPSPSLHRSRWVSVRCMGAR